MVYDVGIFNYFFFFQKWTNVRDQTTVAVSNAV